MGTKDSIFAGSIGYMKHMERVNKGLEYMYPNRGKGDKRKKDRSVVYNGRRYFSTNKSISGMPDDVKVKYLTDYISGMEEGPDKIKLEWELKKLTNPEVIEGLDIHEILVKDLMVICEAHGKTLADGLGLIGKKSHNIP